VRLERTAKHIIRDGSDEIGFFLYYAKCKRQFGLNHRT
jgi:hypothetical protein